MSALTSVSSSQPVRADTATTGWYGPEQTEYRLRFFREYSVPVREKA